MNDSLKTYLPELVPDTNILIIPEVDSYINYDIQFSAYNQSQIYPPLIIIENSKFTNSLLAGNNQSIIHQYPEKAEQISSANLYITISFIVIYFLFSIIRQTTGITLNTFLKSIFSFKEHIKYIEDKKLGILAPFPILTLISIWVLSLLIHHIYIQSHVELTQLNSALFALTTFAAISSAYILKTLIYKLFQLGSGEFLIFNNIGHSFHQAHLLLGFVILPWLFIINSPLNQSLKLIYHQYVLIVAILLALLFLMIRSVLFLRKNQQGGYIYFILYFCSVELLPLLYLGKLLKNLG
jgi:hypothetical protein